jgi:flagellar biosynthesis protein FlhG
MSAIKVIAVASGKGGVGKSNVSCNLSYQLALKHRRVLLMDADLGLANIDVLMGLRATKNLADVIAGRCELKDIVLTGPGGVNVIPAASGLKQMAEMCAAEHAAIIQGISGLGDQYDYLVVDTAAGIADSVVSFCQASQHVLIVISDEPTSMADAYGLIKVLNREANVSRFKVVCNMVGNDAQARAVFARLNEVAQRFLDVSLEYSGAIPRDEFLQKAVVRQQLVSKLYPSSESSLAFKRLANTVDSWEPVTGPSGHIQFFFEQLVLPHEKVSMAW